MKVIFIGLLVGVMVLFTGCGLQLREDTTSNKVEVDGQSEFDFRKEQPIDSYVKAYVITDKHNGQEYIVVNNNGRGLAITPRIK